MRWERNVATYIAGAEACAECGVPVPVAAGRGVSRCRRIGRQDAVGHEPLRADNPPQRPMCRPATPRRYLSPMPTNSLQRPVLCWPV